MRKEKAEMVPRGKSLCGRERERDGKNSGLRGPQVGPGGGRCSSAGDAHTWVQV